MQESTRAIGAHRKVVVSRANHEQLCARHCLVVFVCSCRFEWAGLPHPVLDRFGEALRDRSRVVQPRLLARHPKPHRSARQDEALPRYGTRQPLDFMKCLGAKRRNAHDHSACCSQPEVRASDRFDRAIEAYSTRINARTDSTCLQLRGDELFQARRGGGVCLE